MPLHKDFIRNAVKKSLSDNGFSENADISEKIIVDAVYNVLNSRDFERYIAEIIKNTIR